MKNYLFCNNSILNLHISVWFGVSLYENDAIIERMGDSKYLSMAKPAAVTKLCINTST